jgi:hypothetical protein
VIEVVGDQASPALLVSALDSLAGFVLVDLTRCASIDTAIIGPIIGKALELGKAGSRLELVVPTTAPFTCIAERLRVGMLLHVLEKTPIRPDPSTTFAS